MDPLWLLYTDATGAPAASMSSVSSEFCEFCTSALNLVASAELIDDACTITLRASRTLLALCNCIIEDPPFISFSMMAIALPNVSITSNNSFCDFFEVCVFLSTNCGSSLQVCLRCRGTAHEIVNLGLKRLTWSSKQRVPDHSIASCTKQRTLRALCCEPRHLRLWSSTQGLSGAEPPCSLGSPKLRCQRMAETKRRNRTRMSSLQENVTTRNASLLWSLSQNGYGFPFFLHLRFVHLLFLDFFLFPMFSLSRFVIHLICRWSHLSLLPLACNN